MEDTGLLLNRIPLATLPERLLLEILADIECHGLPDGSNIMSPFYNSFKKKLSTARENIKNYNLSEMDQVFI